MRKTNKISDLPSHLTYSSLPNLVIGFHGCDKSVFDRLVVHGESFKASKNDYDWLGNGMYFWEQNLERAWEWARAGQKNPKSSINTPAVVGAVIDLGFCLNLLDSNNIKSLQAHYEYFEQMHLITGTKMPENKNLSGNTDFLLRRLDCAVIEDFHEYRKQHKLKPYDSVRGVFFEGEPIYPNSGFRQQSHIQICIRNPNCILGIFAPKEITTDWDLP
jgi:hypothetical protein